MSTPITPDERAAMRETVAALDAAWEVDDPTRPLVTEHATLTLLAHVASAVPRLLDALDTAEEKITRQRDRLRAREEQVRRLRAEVTRLHALVADLRTAPVWDEDTVTEAVARALRALLPLTPEPALDATATAQADAALAVVRRHLPVFAADIDGLAVAIFEHSHEPSLPDDQRGMEEARARALDYVQTYVEQSESRATVQAEALRDAADEWHAKHYGTRPDAYKFLWTRADRLEKGADRG